MDEESRRLYEKAIRSMAEGRWDAATAKLQAVRARKAQRGAPEGPDSPDRPPRPRTRAGRQRAS